VDLVKNHDEISKTSYLCTRSCAYCNSR